MNTRETHGYDAEWTSCLLDRVLAWGQLAIATKLRKRKKSQLRLCLVTEIKVNLDIV